MKYIYIYTILIFSFAFCSNEHESWKTFDFGSFKMQTPDNWKVYNTLGIENYIEGLTNGEDTLKFDFGTFSYAVGLEDSNKYKFAIDTVNGKLATIVMPDSVHSGLVAMSISQFRNDGDLFRIEANNVKNINLILSIFKTIIFPDSDSLNNSKLTLDKFKKNYLMTGKSLFKFYCSSCHTSNKDLIGPALNNICKIRTQEWIYEYLTTRSNLKIDNRSIENSVKYGKECNKFIKLSKEELTLILDYIN